MSTHAYFKYRIPTRTPTQQCAQKKLVRHSAQKKLARQGQAAADALRLRLEKQSHYEAMGLGHTATSSDIKKAYRKLVLQHHPDKTQTDDEIVKAESDTKFKRVQAAYEVLKDEALRRQYDLALRVQPTYMRPSYSASSSRDFYTPDFSHPPPRPRQTPFEAARGKGRNGKGRSRRAPHF
ncbi:hypothetical protein SARC_01926 [Sphaeroforma arctica JP610]|uniref:J domain-containing protein n=1 Tax=Sphaeroforma arctica JP610 TaxID=667725 RepID=A0A0L0GC94_9EUKA|nr:hypothetical protein SARC_01926 [Sphaeroforma arctica JP610]KNC85888.1 hypothetical protein SARC_01926 [Sphaeroforma arctica JP610]|eukprot:XP_014159790.1 hypothetical protein SARC_01926 [Sphaeroforma arctica JP610]